MTEENTATPEEIVVTAEVENPEPRPAVTLSPELSALIAAMRLQTLEAVAEMRKPSAEEQQKIDEERGRRLAIARNAAFAAQEGERQAKMLQGQCSHSKPNGKTAFVAQVNSNGCYRAFCPYCHYTSPPIRVEEYQKANGLEFHKMSGITIAWLEAAAARSLPPVPPQAVPFGFTPEAL
jgi:hypothetical protein